MVRGKQVITIVVFAAPITQGGLNTVRQAHHWIISEFIGWTRRAERGEPGDEGWRANAAEKWSKA